MLTCHTKPTVRTDRRSKGESGTGAQYVGRLAGESLVQLGLNVLEDRPLISGFAEATCHHVDEVLLGRIELIY